MLTRSGIHPDCGDWEFFVLGGDARLLARGKIDSCIACHRDYAEQGFVSRAYLANAVGTNPSTHMIATDGSID